MAAGVLFVEPSRYASYGGTKRVLVNVVPELDRERFAPHVLFYRGGPWVADLEKRGIPATVYDPFPYKRVPEVAAARPLVPAAAWLAGLGMQADADGAVCRAPARQFVSDLVSWARLHARDRVRAWRLVRRVPPGTRLIHVNASMATDYDWLHVARRLRIPFVTHEHGRWKPRTAAYGAVAAQAASVLCLTEERVEQLRAHLRGRVRADHLPNGIAADRLAPTRDRAAVRAELGVAPDRLLLITAGHLQEWKGQTLAVEAATTLARRDLDFVWLLCGAETQAGFVDLLARRIAAEGLSGKVLLLGERMDMPDLFAAADLAVHTSIRPEPFGLVVLEAMAQGLPVVGPAEGSIPSLVRDGVDGRLVPPRDSRALALAILDLASQPELRRRMGGAGRARVRESFDVRVQARRLEAIYERALGGGG